MYLSRYVATCVSGFLCVSVLFLVGCQRREPTSTPHPPSPSPTRQTQSFDDWEEIQFPTTDIKLLDDWQWVLYTDSEAVWIAPIEAGQVGAPGLVARNEQDKLRFGLQEPPPGRSAFVIESWDYSAKPYTSTLWLVQPSNPGQLVQLYEGRNPVLRANWSPNGNHVVLVSVSGWSDLVTNFWTDDRLVTPIEHQLRPVSKVAWSPSSDKIFYKGQTEISGKWYMGGWMLNVDSLEATLLFTSTAIVEPSWSPDGKTLAALISPEARNGDWAIRLSSPAGVHLDTVALPGLQRAGGLRWSSDSTRIALSVAEVGKGDSKVGLVDLSSREFSMISIPHLYGVMGWSKNGSAVIVLTFDNLVKKIPIPR